MSSGSYADYGSVIVGDYLFLTRNSICNLNKYPYDVQDMVIITLDLLELHWSLFEVVVIIKLTFGFDLKWTTLPMVP